MKKNSIIFFGTEDFAATILQGLIDSHDFEIKMVVTRPDKPIGREHKLHQPPIKILAKKNGLKVEQPSTLKNFNLQTGANLGIAVQYGLLIPKQILKSLPHGIINIHPSLLPKYRGASPIQSAILNGENKTGVTIMKMDEGLDTGPILLQKQAQIEPNETYTTLAQKLAQIASETLTEAVRGYVSGQIQPQAQDNNLATYCREFKREDGQIDWSKSAEKIYNQWRALQPWPGVFTEAMFGGKKMKIKILKMSLAADFNVISKMEKKLSSPFIKLNKKTLGAVAGDGQTLIIDELQPEGKKIMTAEAFINGYLH
ncbi:MAG: methionyl-tRNA formyltransferase [Candidatus Magasanikbacteria bacterium]|nr:methionyl-tRNA formyltransferase [Candidatus Magasanikbacteria bacterium]